MKIVIISDTHGRHQNLALALRHEKPMDLLIHLGDVEGGEEFIQAAAGCRTEVVAGNCDFFSALCQEKELTLGKYKALLTHGHYYNVNAGIENIRKEAKGRGCDIVMFGHTHRPLICDEKGIVVLNPGSLSYPRQEGKRPSYIVMEINPQGEADFQIRYLA